jgi:hypothetical protein
MRWRVLCVVSLALLAGCGSTTFLGGDATPTETVTPAPVPSATPPPTETPTEAETLPEGLARSGVNNSVLLGITHKDAIRNYSYTWHQRYVEVVERPDGNRTLDRTQTTWVETHDDYRHRFRTVRRFDNTTERYERERFSDDRNWVERSGRASNRTALNWTYTNGTAQPTQDQFADRAAFLLGRFLRAEHSTTALVRQDGDLRYRVVVNGSAISTHPSDENYSAVAYIDMDGIVHRFELRATLDGGSVTQHIHYVWRYEDLGETTADRPAWADRVPANRTATAG